MGQLIAYLLREHNVHVPIVLSGHEQLQLSSVIKGGYRGRGVGVRSCITTDALKCSSLAGQDRSRANLQANLRERERERESLREYLKREWIKFWCNQDIVYMTSEHSYREPEVGVKCCMSNSSKSVYCCFACARKLCLRLRLIRQI